MCVLKNTLQLLLDSSTYIDKHSSSVKRDISYTARLHIPVLTGRDIVRFRPIFFIGQIAKKPDCPVKNRTPGNPSLGSITAQHSSSGRQPNFAALNRGRHLYSAGWPSRWALAHILVIILLDTVLYYASFKACSPSVKNLLYHCMS